MRKRSGQKTNEQPNGESYTAPISDQSNSELYPVLICGQSGSALFSKLEAEERYVFPDYEKYKDTIVEECVELQINGESYSGKYLSTRYLGDNYFPSYEYSTGIGSVFVNDLGMPTSCFWGDTSLHGEEKTKDECTKIACDFLARIVDIDRYEMDVTEETTWHYKVRFMKKLGDLETGDYATVTVKKDGNLYSYASFMLDRVPTELFSADAIDMEKVKASVDNKLSVMLQDVKDQYSRIDFETTHTSFTVLKDGTPAITYVVDVDFIQDDGEYDTHMGELLSFAVKLDESVKVR